MRCASRIIQLCKILKIHKVRGRYKIQFFYLQLQYRRKDEKWIVVEPEVKDGKGNQYTVEYPIEELQPGFSYEAVLTARNAFGWSVPSIPHMFTGGTYIHIYIRIYIYIYMYISLFLYMLFKKTFYMFLSLSYFLSLSLFFLSLLYFKIFL